MKLFNIGMVLNWARKENNRRGCDSVFIKAAEDEYAALLKINKESAKLEASMEKTAPPNTTKVKIVELVSRLEDAVAESNLTESSRLVTKLKYSAQQL